MSFTLPHKAVVVCRQNNGKCCESHTLDNISRHLKDKHGVREHDIRGCGTINIANGEITMMNLKGPTVWQHIYKFGNHGFLHNTYISEGKYFIWMSWLGNEDDVGRHKYKFKFAITDKKDEMQMEWTIPIHSCAYDHDVVIQSGHVVELDELKHGGFWYKTDSHLLNLKYREFLVTLD